MVLIRKQTLLGDWSPNLLKLTPALQLVFLDYLESEH